MITGSCQQKDITFLTFRNIYEKNKKKYLCSNTGAPQYINQILTDLKGETDSNTIIVGKSSTIIPLISPLISIDRSFRQKLNKETLALSDTFDQMDLTDT